MKRLGILVACVAALAIPASSLAAEGNGGAGIDAHLARAQAHVAKVTEKCNVAEPPARCSVVKAKLLAKFNVWEARLEARIAKLEERPDSERKTAMLAKLNGWLTQVQNLQAQL